MKTILSYGIQEIKNDHIGKNQEIWLRRYPRNLAIELADVLIKLIYLANIGIDNNVIFLYYFKHTVA